MYMYYFKMAGKYTKKCYQVCILPLFSNKIQLEDAWQLFQLFSISVIQIFGPRWLATLLVLSYPALHNKHRVHNSRNSSWFIVLLVTKRHFSKTDVYRHHRWV